MKHTKKYLLMCIEVIAAILIIFLIFRLTADTKWEITQYSDASESQAIFYTITSNKKDLVVIDGGVTANAEKVREVIKKNGNHVDAWILTHPHPDHIGAFNEIYAQPGKIKIDQIYDNGLDYEYYDTLDREWDNIGTYATYLDLTSGDSRIKHVSRNTTLEIKDLTFEFMNTYDEISKEFKEDIGNDASLVFKVSRKEGPKTMLFTGEIKDLTFEFMNTYDEISKEFKEDIGNDASLVFKVSRKEGPKTMLFTGDCHSAVVSEYLIKEYGERLKADYVQMGHHGNNTLPQKFYEYVNPSKACNFMNM